MAFCDAALTYTREVADDANEQISILTGGAMTKATQRNARDAWLFPKLTPYQMKLLEVYKKGEKKAADAAKKATEKKSDSKKSDSKKKPESKPKKKS